MAGTTPSPATSYTATDSTTMFSAISGLIEADNCERGCAFLRFLSPSTQPELAPRGRSPDGRSGHDRRSCVRVDDVKRCLLTDGRMVALPSESWRQATSATEHDPR